MATMLNGAAVMDAALLLIAGNEACPQPQTSEHLAAVEIMRLANIIILQNKVDLVKPADASMQYEQVRFACPPSLTPSLPPSLPLIERLAAVEIMRLAKTTFLQNKVDLVKPADASMQYE